MMRGKATVKVRRRDLMAAGLAAYATPGLTQSSSPAFRFPERPVRIVVAYSAGGAADSQARLVAQHLSEMWNTPTVVENRPGGNTLIATQAVQRSAPDGHTMLSVSLPFALNPVMFEVTLRSIPRFCSCWLNIQYSQHSGRSPLLPGTIGR